MTHINAHFIKLSDEKSVLKMGFVENKGQSCPLSFVSKTLATANVSCQLNFRRFVSCHLTPSRPSL